MLQNDADIIMDIWLSNTTASGYPTGFMLVCSSCQAASRGDTVIGNFEVKKHSATSLVPFNDSPRQVAFTLNMGGVPGFIFHHAGGGLAMRFRARGAYAK